MSDKKYDFGMIGLGTMGRNLLLNMADSGFHVSGYDKNPDMVTLLEKESEGISVQAYSDLENFIKELNTPRALMMLVPAGKIVDDVIESLLPYLQPGDLLIDGGNTYFADTERRVQYLESKDIHFFGVGISGGSEGARRGPSMMPGGNKEAYAVVKDIFEAVAAKVNGIPCVTWLGPGACGHFVKMVHNGIEYGMMQILSEVYGLMKGPMALSTDDIQNAFAQWNKGILNSFLVEITADIFSQSDDMIEGYLLDIINDQARSKGTGKWTSQLAMDLQVPVPTIDMAVAMRDLSKYKGIRQAADAIYSRNHDTGALLTLKDLEGALYFSFLVTYAQGMHMLQVASKEYGYNLSMADISKIWRGGCIIRAAMLEDIHHAYQDAGLPHLMLDRSIRDLIHAHEASMRRVSVEAIKFGVGMPALSSTLHYFDMIRLSRMPSNLIQAQRDYFGAHTYERTDREGVFHTNWNRI
jgi:6-phosphogluconate dehydrogenase